MQETYWITIMEFITKTEKTVAKPVSIQIKKRRFLFAPNREFPKSLIGISGIFPTVRKLLKVHS